MGICFFVQDKHLDFGSSYPLFYIIYIILDSSGDAGITQIPFHKNKPHLSNPIPRLLCLPFPIQDFQTAFVSLTLSVLSKNLGERMTTHFSFSFEPKPYNYHGRKMTK